MYFSSKQRPKSSVYSTGLLLIPSAVWATTDQLPPGDHADYLQSKCSPYSSSGLLSIITVLKLFWMQTQKLISVERIR